MFNIIVCSAGALHHVQMKMASAGAGQIQTGFIAKRKHVPDAKGKYHIPFFFPFYLFRLLIIAFYETLLATMDCFN